MAATAVIRATRALGLGVLLAGCSTAAGRIENGVFHSSKGYQVKLPGSGWRVEPDGAADLALKRETLPGGMLVDATCEGKPLGYPLPLLTRHLTFGLTKRVLVDHRTETVNGQPAEHTVLRGTADGMEVEVEAVVLKTARCVHDFLYVAPVSEFEAGRRDFQAVVESFSEGAKP
jgi:hypothetical protein